MRWLPRIERIWGRDPSGARSPYLTRVIWGAARVNVFHRGDADPDCHTHPWPFWTFPLTAYAEEVFAPWRPNLARVVRAWRLHARPAEFAHRVLARAYGRGPIVTLMWTGRPRGEWGFWVRSGEARLAGAPRFRFIPWREYLGLDRG